MRQLYLYRERRDGIGVYGMLYLDGFKFWTIENNNYLIPEGIYTVEVNYSPKFKRNMPILRDVPGRAGIRIHRGTKPEHSKGCILIESKTFCDYLTEWIAIKQPVMIFIKDDFD